MGLLAAVLAIASAGLQNPLPAQAETGDRPPAGAVDASCTYDGGTPGFCKVRIVSRVPARLQLWFPAGRQSAITLNYTGDCLNPGCLLTGDDFGYSVGPTRYRVVQVSASLIRLKEINSNQAFQEIRILSP